MSDHFDIHDRHEEGDRTFGPAEENHFDNTQHFDKNYVLSISRSLRYLLELTTTGSGKGGGEICTGRYDESNRLDVILEDYR